MVVVALHPGLSLGIYQVWTLILVAYLGRSLGTGTYLGTSLGSLGQAWTRMFQARTQVWSYLGTSLDLLVQVWTRRSQVLAQVWTLGQACQVWAMVVLVLGAPVVVVAQNVPKRDLGVVAMLQVLSSVITVEIKATLQQDVGQDQV